MDLWTEFEGITIDRAFALKKLLQTEGRSAFFSTVNAKGESVLIRIIECHFDEDEILARWRGVQSLGHPGFLRIDHFGQFLIEADDITAVYAVFERVDANLGQVLERGRLSSSDATQIALSIASALEALHANGFVHEHIEPANIYAVGETVKLRSDCIRETPEGEAGLEARRRDIQDLALVLKQVLLGAPRPDFPSHPPLPSPFDDIVRNTISGEWGLTEIRAALGPQKPGKNAPPPPEPHPAAAKSYGSARQPLSSRVPISAEPQPARPIATVLPPADTGTFYRRDPVGFEPSAWAGRLQQLDKRWIGAAALFVAVVLFGWMLLRHWSADRTQSAPDAETAPAASQPAVAAPRTNSHPTASSTRAASHLGTQWRVVAFTYNRRDQAQKKAASFGQKHPGLATEVFSPNGKAPWLVTIGGPLDRDAAYALARKAPGLGLPRDTYAQNYAVR